MHDRLPGLQARQTGQIFGDRLAGDCWTIADEQALFEQQLHDSRCTADVVQILLNVFATGPQVGQVRHAVARALEVVDPKWYADRAGHRDQVQHSVRRAAHSHYHSHRVFERLASHDVARLDVLFETIQTHFPGGTALLE